MARIGIKLKWVVVFAVLLLIFMGAYSYFVGTRTLLSTAEAFAFRRMTVPQLAEKGVFQFFYATNRDVADSDGAFEDRYESTRGDSVSFGSFDTSIEPSLGLGMIIDASDWFLNEEIRLDEVSSLDREIFVDRLREQVQASPNQSLLLVVHGFREAFPSALRKTAFLAHVLDINTPVLVFDWPGDQGGSLRGYRRARGIAQASGEELAELLKLIINDVQPERFWMMGVVRGGLPDFLARLDLGYFPAQASCFSCP